MTPFYWNLKGASHENQFGQIWYQKKDLEKLEVRGWLIKFTGPRARSSDRYSSVSGVNNAFEFDSNPSEDRQQIHWPSSEAGGEFVGGHPKAADKKSCSLRPSEDRQQIY